MSLSETKRRWTGLIDKFIVRRSDGTDGPGLKHDGCRYFVLDLIHDRHAAAALSAYADSCESDYPALAIDLRNEAHRLRTTIANRRLSTKL